MVHEGYLCLGQVLLGAPTIAGRARSPPLLWAPCAAAMAGKRAWDEPEEVPKPHLPPGPASPEEVLRILTRPCAGGKPFSAEELRHAERQFASWDKNGDGVLSMGDVERGETAIAASEAIAGTNVGLSPEELGFRLSRWLEYGAGLLEAALRKHDGYLVGDEDVKAVGARVQVAMMEALHAAFDHGDRGAASQGDGIARRLVHDRIVMPPGAG